MFARNQFLGKETGQAKANIAELVNVYPNPFEESAKVPVKLPEQAQTVLEVYNMQGLLISTLANGLLAAGEHDFEFTPAATAEDKIYLVRLQVKDQETVTRIIKK